MRQVLTHREMEVKQQTVSIDPKLGLRHGDLKQALIFKQSQVIKVEQLILGRYFSPLHCHVELLAPVIVRSILGEHTLFFH